MDLQFGGRGLIGLAAAGAVWFVVLARQVSTLRLCLGGLVAVSCFWLPFGQWEAGPLTLTIDRVYCLALLGLAGMKRLLATEAALRFDRGDWIAAALAFFAAASVLLSPALPTLPQEIPPWYRFTTALALPTLLYALLRYRRPHINDARHVTTFFVLFGVYLAATAIAERHASGAFVFPSYIVKPRTLYVGRAVGPFLSAPHLGTWLTIVFAAAVLKLEQVQGRAKLILWALLPGFAYAQYLTQTRSAWLGFAVAGAYALLSARVGITRSVVQFFLLAAGVVVGVFFGDRLLNPVRTEGEVVVAYSWDQRLALADNALAMFLDHPILGWGFGQFERAAQQAAGESVFGIASSTAAEGVASHNVLLRFLVETGVVGTTLLLALFGFWIGRARRALRDADAPEQRPLAVLFLAAIIAYWSEALLHDVTHILQANVLLFFLAGCLPTVKSRA